MIHEFETYQHFWFCPPNNINFPRQVTMSYLQIYQEKIYDLLNSTNKVELSLREHPVKGLYLCTFEQIDLLLPPVNQTSFLRDYEAEL